MPKVKKLTFAPFFLIFFIILLSQLSPILKSYDLIFSLSLNSLSQLITISILIMLSSFSFVLFAIIALDWKLILGVGGLAALAPFLFFGLSVGLVFGLGIFASLMLIFVTLENKMKSYLTFSPNTLLGPSIRHLASFLTVALALVYFLSVSRIISQSGFEIPDSLIDAALNITNQTGSNQTSPFAIPQTLQETANNLIKQTVKDQFQNFLKPYLSFIPAILALFLFLTLQGFTSLLNLLIYPLLWITFYILEKTGFIKFIEEMRPVKKMVA